MLGGFYYPVTFKESKIMELRKNFQEVPFATSSNVMAHMESNPDKAQRDGFYYDWRDVVATFEMQLGVAIADIEEREVAGMEVLYFIKLYSTASAMLYDVSGNKIRDSITNTRAAVCKALDHYNYESDKPVRFSPELISEIRRVYESFRKIPKTRLFSTTLTERLVEIDRSLYGERNPNPEVPA